MKRGAHKIWTCRGWGLGIKRSSDGLWERDGKLLPWFFCRRMERGLSVVVGEYAISIVAP